MRLIGKRMWVLLLTTAVVAIVLGAAVWATSIRSHKGMDVHELRRLAEIPPEAWNRLNERTIFFGHRSVGRDIIDGIQDLAVGGAVVNLNVVETKDPNRVAGPGLAHALVGRNGDPESKIAEFKRVMESGLGDKVDIAFFKFCFVDIGRASNPDAILAAYGEAMDSLKARFPRVTFVHLTVPLCGPPKTAKGVLKATARRFLGRPPVLEENQIRSRYNDLLRRRYSGKEPLFDLALYETLDAAGRRHYGVRKGQEIPILVRAYSDDGGHLNATGRRQLAEQLLIEMANLPSRAQ